MLFHRTLLPSLLPLLSTTTLPSLFFPSQLSSPPLPSPPPCSRLPSFLPLSVPAADVSQVREKKREMDILGTSSALRSNPYFDMRQSPVHIFHADNQHHYQNGGNGYNQGTHQQCEDVWGLDRSMTHAAGEDFSIEELLNLGGLPEEALDQQQPLLLEKLGEEEDDDEKMDLEEDQGSDSSSGPCFKDSNPSELIVPVGDISDLEWVSKIVDDSDLPCSVVSPVYLPLSTSNYSRSPSSGSMTSVSTSSKRTIASFSDKALYIPSKSRTKRARTGGQGWLLHHPLLADPICSSSVSSSTSASSTSSLSSHLLLEPQTLNPIVVRRGRGRPPLHKKKDESNTQQQTQTKQKKKKGRKPKFVPTAAELPETTRNADVGANGRCCSHCGVQKTPQWRAGPMGSKTLCNACGVRYKSGRLLPEYRPAISPTFLDHVHSNSHRKVLEMRRQKESQLQNQFLISGGDSTSDILVCPPPETIPVVQHLVF